MICIKKSEASWFIYDVLAKTGVEQAKSTHS